MIKPGKRKLPAAINRRYPPGRGEADPIALAGTETVTLAW